MNKPECLNILRSMACGSSRVEREAVDFAEKVFKREKKYKRWKRKYLEVKVKVSGRCPQCRYDSFGYGNVCKYCSQNYTNRFEQKGED